MRRKRTDPEQYQPGPADIPNDAAPDFVSRAGLKLSAALNHFQMDVRGLVCADFGCHVGGFVDCLLQRGAARVYAVDTAYGQLAWKLRRDPRVIVRERTNAMHVALPETVELVTIDVGWTPQARILPSAQRVLGERGRVVTLIKPHYEAGPDALVEGVLPDSTLAPLLERVLEHARNHGWRVDGSMESPLRGHGGNREFLVLLSRA